MYNSSGQPLRPGIDNPFLQQASPSGSSFRGSPGGSSSAGSPVGVSGLFKDKSTDQGGLAQYNQFTGSPCHVKGIGNTQQKIFKKRNDLLIKYQRAIEAADKNKLNLDSSLIGRR